MNCPYCKENTSGEAHPEHLLSYFGGSDEDSLPTHRSDSTIKLICEHCKKAWLVNIKVIKC